MAKRATVLEDPYADEDFEYWPKMAASLPLSELVIINGASHLALLDKPDAINDGLVRLVDRSIPGKMVLGYQRFCRRFRRRG